MKVICIWLVITSLYMVAGCEKDSPFHSDNQDQHIPLTETNQSVIEQDNEFGINVFRNVAISEEENVMISPLSLSIALGMTLNGAQGDTKEAMEKTLRKKGFPLQDINATYRKLLHNLPVIDPSVTINIANSIWHRNKFSVRQAFIDTNEHYFKAKVSSLDFDDPAAKNTINDWVDRKTSGNIERIIDDIEPNHVMFLINAVYFNGQWTNAFDPDKTSKKQFQRPDGSHVQVPMMHYEKTNFYYHATDSLEVAEIPYGRGSYRMTILLPKKGTVDDAINGLTPQKWRALVATVDSSGRRELYLPKLELDYKTNMKNVLKEMGMGIAFRPDNANFQGINEATGHNLYIDEVMHKTYIKVDEKGTEAAAATSVGVGITSMPPVMRVDQPFVVAIREQETGSILFMGRITNPAS